MSNEQKKYREWTIHNGDTANPSLVGPSIAYAEVVRVIESSALRDLQAKYDEAVAEIQRLKSEYDYSSDAYWKWRDAMVKE